MIETSYTDWFAEFTRLAQARELEWLVHEHSPTLHAAYEQGVSPEEELYALAELSEWRGCGCGGGG